MISTSNSFSAEVSGIDLSDHEYDVFLSFRGPDTRAGFTDHLYKRLIDANIKVYRDDEELRKGEEIGPGLLQAINKSTIAIPIFSKGYAESKWCLKELVEINNCKRSREMKVMPIFYYVTPSEVRHQCGSFEKAFASHERENGNTIIKEWKEVLNEIGTLSGWEIPSNTYSREGDLVDDVMKEVSFALKKAYVKIPNDLVGLGCHVQKILEMLSLETRGVRVIGIHGMGGIGKTTLAKFMYNHVLSKFKFQGSSFLADARSKDIEYLNKKLSSDILARKSGHYGDRGTLDERFTDKKVLVVIDDVDETTPMKDLIGEHGKYLFASGSRIILTTRDYGSLMKVQVDASYELSGMSNVHSLQLFCRHAFGSDNPKVDYTTLSEQIVETTGGLPLALEVIGSSLRNQSKQEWNDMYDKLKDVPADRVSKKLRISYEELDERQKHIFLDIACFFIGWDKEVVIHFWDARKFYPGQAMGVLQRRSLIKIHDGILWMHDQLRDLGREIVCEGNIDKPEKQTRLWDKTEATRIFMAKKEKENIQGIYVEFNEKSYPYFTQEEFAKLSNVRLFWVESDYRFNYPDCSSNASPSNFLRENSHIFSELRWLSWPDFPHMYIETSNFSLSNLTILNLSNSFFTIDWDGWNQIKMTTNLKVLDLSRCDNLVKTPNFSSHPRLERLILVNCNNLVEIDESIGTLEHLVHLNLKFCEKLHKLPKELYCIGSLIELHINFTDIAEIPRCGDMVKLEVFSAYVCKSLNNISFNSWTSLKKLSLSSSKITLIPDSIKECVSLLELNLVRNKLLKKLPESMGGLESLIQLNLMDSGIEELPNSIGCLKNMKLLKIGYTPIREFPTTIEMAGNLEEIDASCCHKLSGLPKLPESLIKLSLPCRLMAVIPDLSNLINIRQLEVPKNKWIKLIECGLKKYGPEDIKNECPSREGSPLESPGPWWIGRLGKAEKMELGFPTVTILHPDLGTLSQLKELLLKNCYRLQSIPKLPSHLTSLRVYNCESLVQLEIPPALEVLDLEDCHNLVEISGRVESLKELRIWDCRSLVKIPDLLNVKTLLPSHSTSWRVYKCESLVQLEIPPTLEVLDLVDCDNLVEISGRVESLKELHIRHCKSLAKIPDLLNVKTLLPSHLTSLRVYKCESLVQLEIPPALEFLDLGGCHNLVEISGRVESLKKLQIWDCRSLVKIPDLLNVKTLLPSHLTSLSVYKCESSVQLEIPPTLEFLDLEDCDNLVEIFGRVESLKELRITHCKSLAKITDLLNVKTLLPSHLKMTVYNCESLVQLEIPPALEFLDLGGCHNLVEISGRVESLKKLQIWDCRSLVKIPDLLNVKTLLPSHLTSLSVYKCESLVQLEIPPTLEVLDLKDCEYLVEISGRVESLKELRIGHCKSLAKIPDLLNVKTLLPSHLKMTVYNCESLVQLEIPPALEFLDLGGCHNLVEISGRVESLKKLEIWDCRSLVKIPDLLNVKTLKSLAINGCLKLCDGELSHDGPILTDNPPKSESERSFMSSMLKICGHVQSTSCLGKRKGKEMEEAY